MYVLVFTDNEAIMLGVNIHISASSKYSVM